MKLPGLDIVCINTPNFLHADQTILAAQAGKHIVIEKPIAIHWKDMKRMKEAVDKAKVTTIVGFVLRWNPLFVTVKKMIADGVLGKNQLRRSGLPARHHPAVPSATPGR